MRRRLVVASGGPAYPAPAAARGHAAIVLCVAVATAVVRTHCRTQRRADSACMIGPFLPAPPQPRGAA